MPADLPDPDRQTPPERELERRSNAPAVSPWLIVGLIGMAVGVVYVVSALL